MSSLLIAPHSDDEVLFASFIVTAHRPEVLVVAGDPDPGMRHRRSIESRAAGYALGRPYGRMHFTSLTEGSLSLELVTSALRFYAHDGLDEVFAPAIEDDGHEEHNLVGAAAVEVFGGRVRQYLTYTRTGGRSRSDRPIEPPGTYSIADKLRALACFTSQIAHPARRPWFYDQLDMREWWA